MDKNKFSFLLIFISKLNDFDVSSDVCKGYCENKGTCVKDARGTPSCRCVGSFIGPHCAQKSEFAYIAGGIAATVVFLIIIALFVWMICARYETLFIISFNPVLCSIYKLSFKSHRRVEIHCRL